MPQLLHGDHELGHRLELELRDEARRPQHAQRVVDERHLGLERRAQPVRREVGGAREGVDELGVGQPDRHRVHGEVTAREIGLEIVGELDLGLAALGTVDLGPERGDLDDDAFLLAADGAEALSLQPHVVGPRAHDALDRIRARARGDVDVGGRTIEQRVTHAAADEEALVPRLGEQPRELLDRRRRVEVRAQSGGSVGHADHSRRWPSHAAQTSE